MARSTVTRSRRLATLFVVLATACLGRAQTYRFEAEDGTLLNVVTSSSVGGYSGSGYVTGFSNQDAVGDYVELSVDVPAGLYEMFVGYRSPFGGKGYDYCVAGTCGSGFFDQSSGFAEDLTGLFDLGAGSNLVSIGEGWAFYEVDYVEFRSANPPALQPVAPTLSNPSANLVTRQLMSYLADNYGKKTLSGQHHESSKNLSFPVQNYLNKSGGIVPAVRAGDFIEYSPSRVQYGANPRNESEQAIQWAQQNGGVVSMMWHWNAPTDLINQPGQEWWRGFYSDATTFDLPGALANPGGSDYQLLLRDIDAIAVELQKFEDAGVPVIWHPLHEAQGGWFWWGAHGPEAFTELWGLVYDRLTDHHGLDNLIWEYVIAPHTTDGFNEAWYPGDDKVDLVGLDIYGDGSSNMSSEWGEALEQYNGEKIVALSETGTVPDAETMDQFGIAWSYFAPWKGSFVDQMVPAELQATLNHENVVNLDDLPAFPWGPDGLAGDFNLDGVVDAADYTVWRDRLGEVFTPSDHAVWSSQYGVAASATATSQTVPEPSAAILAGAAAFIATQQAGRR